LGASGAKGDARRADYRKKVKIFETSGEQLGVWLKTTTFFCTCLSEVNKQNLHETYTLVQALKWRCEMAEKLWVTLDTLAAEFGRNKNSFSRTVRSMGFVPTALGVRGRLVLSAEDAANFRATFQTREVSVVAAPVVKSGVRGVYLLSIPPNDIKIGWSDDVANRLRQHRTIAPRLKVVAVWAITEPHMEQVALRLMHRAFPHVGGEVFEGDVQEANRRISLIMDALGYPRIENFDALKGGAEDGSL
jgi:AraC-like DNA-binding protein